MSAVLEAKSTRQRCILVVAIIIVIEKGDTSICNAERNQKLRVFPHRINKNVRHRTDLIIGTASSSMVSNHK